MDEAFQQINTTLADDLLSEIMKQPPTFFEYLVVKLLTQMGYGGSVDHAGTVIGQTGDEGIDGIIREDKQRCTRGYKRYKETSGLIEWKERQIFHSIFT